MRPTDRHAVAVAHPHESHERYRCRKGAERGARGTTKTRRQRSRHGTAGARGRRGGDAWRGRCVEVAGASERRERGRRLTNPAVSSCRSLSVVLLDQLTSAPACPRCWCGAPTLPALLRRPLRVVWAAGASKKRTCSCGCWRSISRNPVALASTERRPRFRLISVFQGACSTNCGHTYCAECLIQFLESHRGRARHQLCAICRATIFNATPSFALRNLANQALRAQGQQPLSEQRQRELDALLPSTAVPAFPASVRAPPLSLSLSHSRSLSCATRESSNDSRKSATIQRSHSLID